MFNKLRLSDARPRTISLRRLRIASPAIDLHLLQTPPHDPSRQAEKKPPVDPHSLDVLGEPSPFL
jgi:hypothetical protein